MLPKRGVVEQEIICVSASVLWILWNDVVGVRVIKRVITTRWGGMSDVWVCGCVGR